MFPRVLLPTDFSPHAGKTVQCIGQIPGIRDLVLLHVLEAGPDNSTPRGQHTVEARIRDSLGRLEALRKEMATPDLPGRVLVHERVRDDVAETILSVAGTEEADLIALGAHGRTLRNLVLGSVSDAVLRDARTSVLVVHDPLLNGHDHDPAKYCRSIFFRILCPVDFSKPSYDTVECIATLGKGLEAILVHVLSPDIHGDDLSIARTSAGNRLDELAERLGRAGITARTVVVAGTAAAEVLRIAREEDVSLILLSRFGKTDYVQAVGIGSTAAEIARKAWCPALVRYPHLHYDVVTRELAPPELHIAETLWLRYHQQKADPATDRIFATFVDGVPAGVARCRRHPDGLEVDGVFILPEFRNRGYARKAMAALMEAFPKDTLYMHSTVELVPFYRTFGFEPIPEAELPKTIRERYDFALGDMAVAQVQPMRRRGPG